MVDVLDNPDVSLYTPLIQLGNWVVLVISSALLTGGLVVWIPTLLAYPSYIDGPRDMRYLDLFSNAN